MLFTYMFLLLTKSNGQCYMQLIDVEQQGTIPEIYSGKIYVPDLKVSRGSPYLFENGFRKGIIYTGKRGFEGVQINIDISKQLLVIDTGEKSSFAKIIVPHEKIDSFFVDGTKFVWSLNVSNKGGYLKKVSEGEINLYVTALNERVIDQQQQSFKYTKKKYSWYMEINGSFKNINSRKRMIQFLSDQKLEDLRSYVKKHVFFWRWYEYSDRVNLVNYLNGLLNK